MLTLQQLSVQGILCLSFPSVASKRWEFAFFSKKCQKSSIKWHLKKKIPHFPLLHASLSNCPCSFLPLPKPCKLLLMYIIIIISRKLVGLHVPIGSDTFLPLFILSSSLANCYFWEYYYYCNTLKKLTKIPQQFHASESLHRFGGGRDFYMSLRYVLFLNDYSRNTNQKCLPPEQHDGFNISCCFFEWGCPIFHQRNTSPISLSLKTAIMCKCLLIYLSQGHWPVWVTTIYC